MQQFGPNAIAEAPRHPFVAFLKKFWDPVPWLLEATVVLELLLGKHLEATIIGTLLVFNAGLSLLQERKAQNALEILRKRLSVKARVFRDGEWKVIDASELVSCNSGS